MLITSSAAFRLSARALMLASVLAHLISRCPCSRTWVAMAPLTPFLYEMKPSNTAGTWGKRVASELEVGSGPQGLSIG